MFFCLTFHLIPLIGPSPIQYNTNQPRLDPLASSHQRRGTTKSQIPHSRHLASFLFSLYTSLPTQRPLSHLNIYTDTNRHFDGSAQTPARPSPPCSTPPPWPSTTRRAPPRSSRAAWASPCTSDAASTRWPRGRRPRRRWRVWQRLLRWLCRSGTRGRRSRKWMKRGENMRKVEDGREVWRTT